MMYAKAKATEEQKRNSRDSENTPRPRDDWERGGYQGDALYDRDGNHVGTYYDRNRAWDNERR